MSARHVFLPWVRQGLATVIQDKDALGRELQARVALPVTLRVNAERVESKLRLYAPGDVTGIDPRQVVRTEPVDRTRDFEPNFFPAIEFDRPDFPWLFTPAAAADRGRLRPWIVLVVVRRQDGVSIAGGAGRGLPLLSIAAPARPADELPDLLESWLWAHAQVTAEGDGSDLEEALAAESPYSLSRIICPRKLEPGTSYVACLVPAFDAGVETGLGRPRGEADQGKLGPAWLAGDRAPAAIRLPVYYRWRFSTGAQGDFESLAERLTARPMPAGVGGRDVRVKTMRFGDFSLPDLGVLRLEGALRRPGGSPPPPLPAPFRQSLRELLNLPADRPPEADPLVTPPVYGGFPAARSTVPAGDESPRWLNELNLDPRHRLAAGLGSLVVIDQQEPLMASAWDQLVNIEEHERRARQAELVRTVSLALLRKHFRKLTPDQSFQLTGPVHARVRASPETLFAQIENSRLPAVADTAAFRRIVRPRGPLVRRVASAAGGPTLPAFEPVARLLVLPAVAAGRPRARVKTADVRRQLDVSRFLLATSPQVGSRRRQVLVRFVKAAEAVETYFAATALTTAAARPPSIELGEVQAIFEGHAETQAARSARGPEVEAAGRAAGPALATAASEAAAPALEVIPHPEFPQPMYRSLSELSRDFLLPGVSDVPPDTVSLLETNPRFVEAFLVGLNHEMSRELLWRRYPTDQRGTYFRNFWDLRGSFAATRFQIPPLHLWSAESGLGENFLDGRSQGRMVLLIRGELLRRYPGTLIYAVKAKTLATLDESAAPGHPIFRGRLEPDVHFLGFDMTAADARGLGGDPGWFFVLQQQPTEPRFGLEVAAEFGQDVASLESWNDLAWGHVAASAAAFDALGHLGRRNRLDGTAIGGAAWGFNAAHTAGILIRRPVRVAIHARRLLTVPGEET